RAGEELLVGHRLRPRDARAHQEHAWLEPSVDQRRHSEKSGRVCRRLLCANGTGRQEHQLGSDGSPRQVRVAVPALRAREAVLRETMETARCRGGEVKQSKWKSLIGTCVGGGLLCVIMRGADGDHMNSNLKSCIVLGAVISAACSATPRSTPT